MERIVIVSTNNNPDYYFYSPYIKKAWNSLGWKVCVMIAGDVSSKDIFADYEIRVPNIEGLRSETLAQASRLYAANYFNDNQILMTSDMDLLPLKNYWNPDHDKITNYGHDLTDYTFLPMGYTAMNVENWKKVMKLNGSDSWKRLEEDAKELGDPYKPDWETWWNFDWKLLTMRLKDFDVTKILRGRRPGSCFALGRIDRGDSMQIPNETLIDAHCENNNVQHPEKLAKFLSIFETVYGKL